MSETTTQNVLMYCGAMAGVVAFWLVVLGLSNGSLLQVAGALLSIAVAIGCFRGYAAAVRRERQERDAAQ